MGAVGPLSAAIAAVVALAAVNCVTMTGRVRVVHMVALVVALGDVDIKHYAYQGSYNMVNVNSLLKLKWVKNGKLLVLENR